MNWLLKGIDWRLDNGFWLNMFWWNHDLWSGKPPITTEDYVWVSKAVL